MAHVLRNPQIDLTSILADQNPHIDIKIQAYENSTRNFIKALTNYKNRAITTISERRKHQATEKKKLLEKAHLVEAETNQCKLKEIELVEDLEREKEERKDAELSVAAFKRQLASLRDKCVSIEGEIEQYRAITENLRREKNKERAMLSTHASHISPEFISCERRLSCVIEGIEKDRLLVRFQNIDKSEPIHEFSFVIDISSKPFKGEYLTFSWHAIVVSDKLCLVITSSPHLPMLPIFVEDLNNAGDIYEFFKRMRRGYEEMSD